MRKSLLLATCTLALLFQQSLYPSPVYSQGGVGTGPYTEYPLPWSGAAPLGITADGNGTVWFAATATDSLVAFHPSDSSFVSYLVPNNATKCEVWSLAVAPDGAVWFGDSTSNSIWRFHPDSATFASYPIPTGNAYPFQLSFGHDGMLYFTELYGGKIGRLSPATGQIAEFSPPSLSSGPAGFDFDKNGKMWIAEDYTGKIAAFDTKTGDFVEYPLAPSGSSLRGVAVDGKGMIWVSDSSSSSIFLFNPSSNSSRTFESLSSDFGSTSPYLMKSAPDGSVWFNERTGNRVGRLNPSSMQMTEFAFPYLRNVDTAGLPGCCRPISGSPYVPREVLSIALDGNNDLWFTEFLGNMIGVVHSDYSPPFAVSVDQPGGMAMGSSRILNVTVSSSSPSDIEVWIGRITPSSNALTVTWLWSNPATVAPNGLVKRSFNITVPLTAAAGYYDVVFYANDFPNSTVIASSLVVLQVVSGGGGVDLGLPYAAVGAALLAICFAVVLAGLRMRKSRSGTSGIQAHGRALGHYRYGTRSRGGIPRKGAPLSKRTTTPIGGGRQQPIRFARMQILSGVY